MGFLTYTSDELIAEVRNRAYLNDTAADGTQDADILRYLNSEMKYELVPQVMKMHEEYFVVREHIGLNTTGRYRINERAIGQKLRDVVHIDSQSNRTNMPRISPDQLYYHNADNSNEQSPTGFMMEGNYIVLVPVESPATGGSIEVSFFFRPGDLVLVAETRKVTNVVGKVVTVDSTIPSGWTGTSIFDIHSSKSGAEIKVWSEPVDSATGTTITFTNVIDGTTQGTTAVAIGDRVCLEFEAAIPGLPLEIHPVLAQAAANRIIEAMGDIELLQFGMLELNRMLKNMNYLLDQRVEGQPQKVVGRGSILWKGRGYRRGW